MGEAMPKGKRPGRPHIVPPAPEPLYWSEQYPALEPLPGEVRMLLWRAVRWTEIWAAMETRREGLFNPATDGLLREIAGACMREPELIEALGVLTTLRRAPHRVDAERLAEAFAQLQEWADARGWLPAAALFAETAARVTPQSAARANDAARLCRRTALNGRAEEWYLRAYTLGVRGKGRENSKQVLWALLGYGALMRDLGRHDEAREHFESATRRAFSLGLHREAAEAHHDLLLLCADQKAFGAAAWHARLALKLYPLSHRLIPALAHDFSLVLVQQAYFTPALSLLEKTVPVMTNPAEQTIAWSTLAWAAAGCGRLAQFGEAERQALRLVSRHEEFVPTVLEHLAEGAHLSGDLEKARQYATRAAEAAHDRQDATLERDALELIARIDRHSPPLRERETLERQRLTKLAQRFAAMLKKWMVLDHLRSRTKPDSDNDEPGTEVA